MKTTCAITICWNVAKFPKDVHHQIMSCIDLLVDDNGKLWWTQSHDLQNRYRMAGTPGTPGNLPGYLVRNLGHVRLRFSAHQRGVRVTFREGHVGLRAITTTTKILLPYHSVRFVAELIGDYPALHMVPTAEDVIAIMLEQRDEPLSSQSRFFRIPLPLGELAGDRRLYHLRNRYDIWRQARGDVATARSLNWASSGPDKQFVARVAGERAEFVEVGRGYTAVAPFVVKAIGTRVDEQPDHDYGAWISTCLLEAHHTRLPHLDLVEATIVSPGGSPVRLRYERLLLPWSSSTAAFVSSASAPRAAFPARSLT